MNKEIHHEGWLIKSPPTKRILRARWRKRWFTLKQGEIPGQFCLEYYTDRNCRKLKGVIDLDQCEQVDSGLHLEHRKQKFQYMFDIKTPNRIYYLAAETENDMRDWVNCICQVCNLHDFTKQPGERQYYNLCDDTYESSQSTINSTFNDDIAESAATAKSKANQRELLQQQKSNIPDLIRQTENMTVETYQNNDFHYVNTSLPFNEVPPHGTSSYEANANATLERTQSLRSKPNSSINDSKSETTVNHNRSQSLIEQPTTSASLSSSSAKTVTSSTGITKRIPENLVLSDTAIEGCLEPSPALSTCSGPYIPISECYSGTKFMCDDNPTTPLNNLDPKFYTTPRSDKQIGLNLTVSHSYSPKIYNCPQQLRPRSGRSSPTDSESVFTDDEDWPHSAQLRDSMDRNARPSDSSVENEAIVFTYKQRFSKMPDDSKGAAAAEDQDKNLRLTKPKKLIGPISTCDDEKNREMIQFSDTENTSPAIGPKDSSSCVEESYDIPRSHNLPYYNLNPFNQASPRSCKEFIRSSTPNLNSDVDPVFSPISSKTLPRPHFYTNAAPTKTEGNVFRYDFIEQPGAPAVNRSLKPKLNLEEKGPGEEKSPLRPPSIDRKLKPAAYKDVLQPHSSTSLRRSANPKSLVMSSDSDFVINHKDLETRTLPRIISTASNRYNSSNANLRNSTISSKSNAALQYLELDVSNPPPPRLKNTNSTSLSSGEPSHSLDIPSRVAVPSSVEYKFVDFLKTEAFKRVKEDAEKNRRKD